MKNLKLALLVLLLPLSAFAGVNLKNGNFYIAYTDIIVPGGGNDLEIVRTYNSKALEKGWFGFGWGSDFETWLSTGADGSVTIRENGSGARTRFTPRQKLNPTAASDKIISAMRKKNSLSDKVAGDLKKKLINDADLRLAYARRFGVTANLSSGTVLYSNVRGLQEVHVVKEGYLRKYNDGKTELFSKAGKLMEIKDKNGYKVSLEYKNKRVYSITDSQAKQLFFSWYPDGKVKSIWSVGDKKTHYKYDGNDLVSSTDVGGNTYLYSYDSNHNMTKITYGEGKKKRKNPTYMAITYTPKTQFVSSIVDRQGKKTTYEYGSNPKNPKFHYWTIVGKKNTSGKDIKNRYEYEVKSRPDGSRYTYRILTIVNNLKTETIYSECCSLPLKITRGKDITNFEYNKKGLLTKKTSNKGEFVQLDYHKEFNKITKVVNSDGWTKFDYDKKGNLSKAINSKGKSVLLIYDRTGKITKMIDYNKKNKKKRSLSFKYNALGKPVEIAMSKVGTINVAYDNYGEIKKVESKQGHKMALQVTQSFQSLLSIVKPAGVNLNL